MGRRQDADRQDLLYVLLIAGGHIVTLLRPRKHAIHPSGERPLKPCGTVLTMQTCTCC